MKSILTNCSPRFLAGLLALAFVTPLFAEEGDAKRGEAVFQQCSVCHQVGPTAANGIGPNLTGVVNRKMGSLSDFSYDTGLQKAAQAGMSWDKDKIFKWLADPQGYIRGVVHDDSVTTKMTIKVSDEQARRDVIAYIATFSGK
ncbi:cytochrome c, class I [Pseudomonas agarici]|uniref:Cytochrome c, class I n=1 Tax=Pseudomonas agarici TaxID=46677 RepID=A0A0X1T7K6_PSEAA|nr:c-type cytochrome [Pseudomonas agarici]AMB88110.1 cytochrome c, class I [Pseudomonas agarici]NWB93002.1 c-type cytochrome [Pseudomonas agarici]NWC09269.1 c-type cytochrome [Pseudomonas agarici]